MWPVNRLDPSWHWKTLLWSGPELSFLFFFSACSLSKIWAWPSCRRWQGSSSIRRATLFWRCFSAPWWVVGCLDKSALILSIRSYCTLVGTLATTNQHAFVFLIYFPLLNLLEFCFRWPSVHDDDRQVGGDWWYIPTTRKFLPTKSPSLPITYQLHTADHLTDHVPTTFTNHIPTVQLLHYYRYVVWLICIRMIIVELNVSAIFELPTNYPIIWAVLLQWPW